MYISKENNTLLDIIMNFPINDLCDEFIIISGYLGPEPIIELSKKGINTKIYYGMANENLNVKFHNKLIQLDSKYENLEIAYPQITTHAKIYVWKK